MPNERVREVVTEFVSLIRNGSGDREEDESALERLLDELAAVRHGVRFEFDDRDHSDPPEWPFKARYALASERFPDYGYYNVAMPVTKEIAQATECVVGDAIDDIADIAGDLWHVVWAWENTSEADALWHFEGSYYHWGQHLRELQMYLFSLKRGL